jgi:antitoxin ParD1/3/4
MQSYRRKLVIQDPNQVVLTNLPFKAGQHVEVLVFEEDSDVATRVQRWQKAFRDTQTVVQPRKITEEEIAVEIAAHRDGR